MTYRSLVVVLLLFCACKKYKDPSPITDDRIKNKYCNDPNAVNFNWDFPGIPDNTVCIYPTQLFNGFYKFQDTTIQVTGEYISNDSFFLTFQQIDSTRMSIMGFCGTDKHYAHATRYFQFTLDSLAGFGQVFCNNKDTIAGGGSKQGVQDTSTIKLVYQLQTDTGTVFHKGTAFKN